MPEGPGWQDGSAPARALSPSQVVTRAYQREDQASSFSSEALDSDDAVREKLPADLRVAGSSKSQRRQRQDLGCQSRVETPPGR
jgi:hypothetical protein